MCKVKARARLVSNIFLVLIVGAIMTVCFLPQPSVPISSLESVGAIYNGNRENRQVSVMINVYENAKIVNGMLDVLNSRNAKATFFVGGCWADDNGETLSRIIADGHELGNHGYFHKDHKKLSYQENLQEISLTSKITTALCGRETNLFAPPSGSFGNNTVKAANDLNHKVIMWSKDTIDWRDKDEQLIFKRATDNIQNGDLILMHPKEHTLNVLDDVIDFYQANGLAVVTVSENIA